MSKKKIGIFILLFIVGTLLYFFPHSENIPPIGWKVFVVFIMTIAALILKPLPLGALCIIALSIITVTKTLTLEEALAGFQNDIVWLVLLAFFISNGFIKTGLGKRIAYYFVILFGKKTLGLSYGLLASDLILAPAIPSVTARSGGVIFPIVEGLAQSFGSTPELKTERKIGSFLMKVSYQGSVITSAFFITAMAANPVLVNFITMTGHTITWGQWALAAVVPGLLSLIAVPYCIYKLYPPEIKDTPGAKHFAKLKLDEMGSLTSKEYAMLGIFLLLIILWVFGSFFSMRPAVAAFIGLSCILILEVLTWKEVIEEAKAWDTFIWFATLITLASALNKEGFTPWVSDQVVTLVENFPWGIGFFFLYLIYFYSHYFFASSTAHAGAMFPAFLMVAISLGTPALLASFALAFATSLFGGLTHYGSGPAPLFYGAGYVDIKNWWRIGFWISLVNIALWLGVGSLWWKLLAIW